MKVPYLLKKDITIVFIILLVLTIGLIFLYIKKNLVFEDSQPIDAIPTNAAVIIQINQPEKTVVNLLKNTAYSSDLEHFESFSIISQVHQFIDTSAVFKNEYSGALLDRSCIISLHPSTEHEANWLATIPLKKKSEEKEITKHLLRLEPDAERVKYYGSSILAIQKSSQIPISLYVTIYKGIISISNNRSTLELSVNQRNENRSLLDDVAFRNIHKTSQVANSVSVYVNFSQMSQLSSGLFNSNSFNAGFIERIANWSELDLEIRNDAISLNGFTITNEENHFANLFKGVSSQKSEIIQIIPDDTKFLMSYSFNGNRQFKENLLKYATENSSGDTYLKESESFRSKAGIGFEELFFSFIDKEIALIYTEPSSDNPSGNRYLIFNTQGQSKTLEIIRVINQEQENATTPTQWIELDDQTKFPVYSGLSQKMMTLLWQNLFPVVPSAYYTFFRNYIVFANSPEELKTFMYATVLNKSLSAHPYYAPFLENFSFQENFFLFCEVPYIFPFAQKSLNASIFHPTNNQNQALSKFYGLGIQLSSAQNLLYTSVYANYTPQRDKQPTTIWQSRLDSTIIGKPALVDNHNTGEKEILVQDNYYNLYLINNMGRVLWKRPLESPILSEIYQIDFYKNGKLQYLFNTAGRLYLIDRNGNHVAKYPFTLPSTATNGLSVFDYENNKDYRIFLALSDNRVYLFDKNGNRNPGWSPPQTEGTVTSPVQYFSTGGRDYIVFSDQYRNYILDRRGENRVIPARSFIRNPNSLFFLEGDGSGASLVTTTQSGLLAKISLPGGECSFNELFDCPEEHFMTLINENTGKPSYVYVTRNQLQSFNSDGQQEMVVTFDQPILIRTDIYQFSATDIKFGIVEQNTGRIHLIGRDGKNYRGFPLKGNSRFSIGFLKSSAYRFNLIVGGEHNFLNNYRIE